jgi:hypothetical protein
MEILFELSVGAWFGTAIAILELNVIKPILEYDYEFYYAMDQIEMVQLKEGDIIDDNI